MFTSDAYDLGGLIVVSPVGDVDLSSAGSLWSAIEVHLGPSASIVVDCSGIEFMDSMGLQTLLRARVKAAAVGADFGLVAPPGALTRVFELASVDGMFTVHPDLEHAQNVYQATS